MAIKTKKVLIEPSAIFRDHRVWGGGGVNSVYQGPPPSLAGPTRVDNPTQGRGQVFKIPVGVGSVERRGPKLTVPSVPAIRQPVPREKIKVATETVWSGGLPLFGGASPGTAPPLPKQTLLPGVVPRGEPQKKVWGPHLKATPTVQTGGPPVALDLGSLINTGLLVGGKVLTAKYENQPTNAFMPYQNSVGFTDSLADYYNQFTSPTGPVAGTGIPKGYKINCNGQLVKSGRRRRRRLATSSDIKDLAALSAVTTGAEKKTWIATHPS